MKSLSEFKKDSISVNSPSKEWEELYKNLINLFKEWNIEDRVSTFKFEWNNKFGVIDEKFEPIFIKKLIIHVLDIPNIPIWKDIFKIKNTTYNQSYHGSGSNTLVYSYYMELEFKRSVLQKLDSEWVYDNYPLVKEFMEDNELYIRLFNISKLFPIKVYV